MFAARPRAGTPNICVVIAHYNARPERELIALLDQTRQVPAGLPFHTRVVVNAAVDKPLQLPKRHHGVEVIQRANTGYNIGAWDAGWRAAPAFDAYLFLQDECVLRKRGWLAAFVKVLADRNVGLVGESLVWEQPWAELEAGIRPPLNDLFRLGGRQVSQFECFYEHLRRHGVERGAKGSHLQSLVLAARRQVLTQIAPLPLGLDYGEAVSSEIIISKKVQALGLQVRQVGWLPFTQILHPQWTQPRWRLVVKQTLGRWVPWSLRRRMRQVAGGSLKV